MMVSVRPDPIALAGDGGDHLAVAPSRFLQCSHCPHVSLKTDLCLDPGRSRLDVIVGAEDGVAQRRVRVRCVEARGWVVRAPPTAACDCRIALEADDSDPSLAVAARSPQRSVSQRGAVQADCLYRRNRQLRLARGRIRCRSWTDVFNWRRLGRDVVVGLRPFPVTDGWPATGRGGQARRTSSDLRRRTPRLGWRVGCRKVARVQ